MSDPRKFFMKVGDLRPYLRRKVVTNNEGVYDLVDVTDTTHGAYSLSNAVVTFSMVAADGTVKIDKAAGDVEDEDAGILFYEWAEGDTDTPGVYDAEFHVDKGDGESFRLPAAGYLRGVLDEALT